jgi:hypothetical protein
VTFEPATVNAAVGVLIRDPARLQDAAMAFDVTDGIVTAIWVVTNPDKLTHIDAPISLA